MLKRAFKINFMQTAWLRRQRRRQFLSLLYFNLLPIWKINEAVKYNLSNLIQLYYYYISGLFVRLICALYICQATRFSFYYSLCSFGKTHDKEMKWLAPIFFNTYFKLTYPTQPLTHLIWLNNFLVFFKLYCC